MAGPSARLSTLGMIALIVPLFAILAGAGWFAASAFISLGGPPMPAIGYVAMIGGIIFSLLVGCGLMALLFYSHRHGYDETFAPRDEDRHE
jgi:hypothetical protein